MAVAVTVAATIARLVHVEEEAAQSVSEGDEVQGNG